MRGIIYAKSKGYLDGIQNGLKNLSFMVLYCKSANKYLCSNNNKYGANTMEFLSFRSILLADTVRSRADRSDADNSRFPDRSSCV